LIGDKVIQFKSITKIELPPSYVDFKTKYADYFYLSSGSALELFPLIENNDSWTNVISSSHDYAHLGNVLTFHKLLIFGMSGVDSETWAFYTGKRFANGEFPIIWILPGEERFFYHSSNFMSFLNVQYYANVASDLVQDYDDYYKSLILKYDKGISAFGYDSIYAEATDLKDLEKIMTKI